mmetsp:Transcript_6715/g.24457  ORF Transcript_6715/g.24457 Transcript_6715/m.24457 type:complete len:306 (+) Transcript_6715:9761-10678(+)
MHVLQKRQISERKGEEHKMLRIKCDEFFTKSRKHCFKLIQSLHRCVSIERRRIRRLQLMHGQELYHFRLPRSRSCGEHFLHVFLVHVAALEQVPRDVKVARARRRDHVMHIQPRASLFAPLNTRQVAAFAAITQGVENLLITRPREPSIIQKLHAVEISATQRLRNSRFTESFPILRTLRVEQILQHPQISTATGAYDGVRLPRTVELTQRVTSFDVAALDGETHWIKSIQYKHAFSAFNKVSQARRVRGVKVIPFVRIQCQIHVVVEARRERKGEFFCREQPIQNINLPAVHRAQQHSHAIRQR